MKTIKVTNSELRILEELWQRGSLTIRQIANAIYTKHTAAEYSSIQKLLDRLEAKGCVNRTKETPAHQFHTRLTREELIGQGLQNLAEKLCEGSLAPLLVHLTESVSLSPKDRQTLQQLIDQEDDR